MLRSISIRESKEALIELTPVEAEAIRAAGVRLASKKTWWGAAPTDETEDGEAAERTIVRVRSAGGGKWWVRVNDAVGVLATDTVQLVVESKIPIAHLLYLFGRSGQFPRLDDQHAEVPQSAMLWDLVASWFVMATERLLRHELIRDYSEAHDELGVARGQIQAIPTARLYYAGQLQLDCVYEEFDYDTPLNRLLKAAAKVVAGSVVLDPAIRRRAIRALARMDEVGDYQPADGRAEVDRRTGHYTDAIALGRHVLTHEGRTIGAGDEGAWTFLIRTPEMAEAGIREVLRQAIGSAHVGKEGRQLVGSTMTFNPDLVFDAGLAVGDVKYKLSGGTGLARTSIRSLRLRSRSARRWARLSVSAIRRPLLKLRCSSEGSRSLSSRGSRMRRCHPKLLLLSWRPRSSIGFGRPPPR